MYLGIGLGISIVKSLVENMNGAVSVASEPGKGTSVYISIQFDIAEEKIDKFQEDCYVKGSLEGLSAAGQTLNSIKFRYHSAVYIKTRFAGLRQGS